MFILKSNLCQLVFNVLGGWGVLHGVLNWCLVSMFRCLVMSSLGLKLKSPNFIMIPSNTTVSRNLTKTVFFHSLTLRLGFILINKTETRSRNFVGLKRCLISNPSRLYQLVFNLLGLGGGGG